jgi:hypothetical protein
VAFRFVSGSKPVLSSPANQPAHLPILAAFEAAICPHAAILDQIISCEHVPA